MIHDSPFIGKDSPAFDKGTLLNSAPADNRRPKAGAESFSQSEDPQDHSRIDELVELRIALDAARNAKQLWHDRWCLAMGAFLLLLLANLFGIAWIWSR